MGLTKMQLLMLALMLGASNLALADEPSFAKLQAMCRDRKDQADQGFCLGFVQAIALHVARENKDCTILQKYIDSPNADRVFPDLIADLDPQDYSGGALKSVEKFLLNRGCS
ncbi:hypothetical protein FVA77_25700 [Phyllobacterium endophyticum]|nr:hypothetical protein FVA77_25700 [Phyllobacterium endophyticum]